MLSSQESRVKSHVLCLLTLFNLICIITITIINHHVSLKLNFNKVLLKSPVKNFAPHQKHHLILFSSLYVVGYFYSFIKKIIFINGSLLRVHKLKVIVFNSFSFKICVQFYFLEKSKNKSFN